MSFLKWLQRLCPKTRFTGKPIGLLPMDRQIKAWHRANRKMAWGISIGEFESIKPPPLLTDRDKTQGFIGIALFYCFGDDGSGNADPIRAAKEAWEYTRTYKKNNQWQCEYIDFTRTEDIRLRPEAPARPKGLYLANVHLGERYQSSSVSQVRKGLQTGETGFGPEGLQLLAITHRHFQRLMNEKKMPFMALADYDVAPYGYEDFYDAPQIFHSTSVLGLGIGHVDRNYPLFGVPTIRQF